MAKANDKQGIKSFTIKYKYPHLRFCCIRQNLHAQMPFEMRSQICGTNVNVNAKWLKILKEREGSPPKDQRQLALALALLSPHVP
jgi:hypothetical protein